MSGKLTDEQLELVTATIRNDLHSLLLEQPQLLALGVDAVAAIFRAGVLSGVAIIGKVAP